MPSLAISIGFILLVASLTFAGKLPFLVPALYLVVSTIAFAVYAVDKSAAQNGRWRVRENTLHILALLGGWPGALAAQRLLHHKSKKRSFRIAFRVTVFLNCLGLISFLVPEALPALRNMFLPAA